MCCYRKILKATWRARTGNVKIPKSIKMERTMWKNIIKRRKNQIGHIIRNLVISIKGKLNGRMPEEVIHKKVS